MWRDRSDVNSGCEGWNVSGGVVGGGSNFKVVVESEMHLADVKGFSRQ
jgi:hypothetical protein